MKEKILITVKTYPILSRKYAELVCTAGVTEQENPGRPKKIRKIRGKFGKIRGKFGKIRDVRGENSGRP